MFINGLKYIPPCQSRFTHKSIDELVKSDYGRISAKVKTCLDSNRMSITDERARLAFAELQRLMSELYSKPLSRALNQRAKSEFKRVKRIQQLLRNRPDICVCRIDKNPAFYIGSAATMAAKAHEYMATTEAYVEIPGHRSPLADNLRAVQVLLDYLVSQKAITKVQHDKLLPNLNTLELAHFHGLPKVHKVSSPSSLHCRGLTLLITVAQHTTATDHRWHTCTNDIDLEVLERSIGTYLFASGSRDNVH